MANNITCPSCNTIFDAGTVLEAELQKKLQAEMNDKLNAQYKKIEKEKEELQKKEEELEEKRKNANDLFREKMEAEKKKMVVSFEADKEKLSKDLQEALRKSIAGDYENQLKMMQQANADNEEKLKTSRQKELEFLKKEKQLKDREEEMEISLHNKLLQERTIIQAEIQKREQEKNEQREMQFKMQLQERDKLLEDNKRMLEEMKRKAEQGSMQLQGEGAELILEKLLRETYPYDQVEEIKKGQEGGDCILTVCNKNGGDCGKILFESKRAKAFGKDWISKLKTDMRNCGANVAILVTEVYPRDMTHFGEKDGVWICSFSEVSSVSFILRNGILQMYAAQKNQEGKADKMQLLYDFLTGIEFRGQVEAIAEGFLSMKTAITKERMSMEKIWKEREKQLDKVLINTMGMHGSIKGIAGASVADIALLGEGTETDEVTF